MKIRRQALLASTLGVDAALGVLVGGGFIHAIIARFLWICIAALALILLAITGIGRLRHRDHPGTMNGFMMGCDSITLGILGFTGGGAAAFHYWESAVSSFRTKVLPLLDAHKEKTGAYPRLLEKLTDEGVPYDLKRRGRYTSTVQRSRFLLRDFRLNLGAPHRSPTFAP